MWIYDNTACHRYNHVNIRQSECNEWFNVTDLIWYLFAESAWLNGLLDVFKNCIFSLHPYCFPYSQTWLYPAVISASLILIYHGSNWLIIAPRGRKYVLWSFNFFSFLTIRSKKGFKPFPNIIYDKQDILPLFHQIKTVIMY